jgi:hypothetical protein
MISEVTCPHCGAKEMHPDGDKLLIRVDKVHTGTRWWSQCLVCAGYYNEDLTAKPIGVDGLNPDYDRSKGWF